MDWIIKRRYITGAIFFLLSSAVRAEGVGAAEAAHVPAVGNFSLQASQQPGPMLSFGSNIIGKDQAQLYLFTLSDMGGRWDEVSTTPGLLYGLRDDLSIFFNVPVALTFDEQHFHSSGFQDMSLQLEYAYYTRETSKYNEMATVVGNFSLPTGSVRKVPPTGFGAPSWFAGATYSRSWTDWYFFLADGILVPSGHAGTRFMLYFQAQTLFFSVESLSGGRLYGWVLLISAPSSCSTCFTNEIFYIISQLITNLVPVALLQRSNKVTGDYSCLCLPICDT